MQSLTTPIVHDDPRLQEPTADRRSARASSRLALVPNVAVVIVTWNRREAVDRVVRAIAAQRYPIERLDVIVVDNASGDATAAHLAERWRPDRIVDNPTRRAHEPEFKVRDVDGAMNLAGFRSLSIVRNEANLGGCGGFNTGLAFVEHALDTPTNPSRPDYVWLVDDDVDLPDNALARLVEAGEADASIGIVGSRTVDLGDRLSTIETTIYYNDRRAKMGDTPPPGHRLHAQHERWVAGTGGTRGERSFEGVQEVDVVSACSLLARWSAVRKVGFWDHRFFIYCDDADWCLRFGRSGHKVVVNLDAVVYHTPWFQKLTPARVYYSQRNAVWLAQKMAPSWRRRRAVARWLASIMYDCLMASFHRRLFHAEIIRRTAVDAILGRGGKLRDEGPERRPLLESLESIGALRADAEIAVLCADRGMLESADWVRAQVAHSLIARGRPQDQPRWVYIVGSDIHDHDFDVSPPETSLPERHRFTSRLRSRIRRQWRFIRRPPDAVIVFDQIADFPLARGRHNVHIDRKWIDRAQVERDCAGRRLRFLARWVATGFLCAWHILRNPRYIAKTRYG